MATAARVKKCKRLPVTATKADRLSAHKAKMAAKANRRAQWRPSASAMELGGIYYPFVPAGTNRHTEKPHEHRAEVARRLRQHGEA